MKVWHVMGLMMVSLSSDAQIVIDPVWQQLLPPAAQIEQTLHLHPQMQLTSQTQKIGYGRAAQVQVGNAAWVLKSGLQIRQLSDGFSFEQQIGAEKRLRLAHKQRADESIARRQIQYADHLSGETEHQLSVELLEDWWAWVKLAQQGRRIEQYQALLRKQIESVQRRIQAGDAARLELMLMQAEAQQQALEQQRHQAALVQQQLRLSRYNQAMLTTQPPELVLGATLEQHLEELVNRDQRHLIDQVLAHDHELRLAKDQLFLLEQQQQRLLLESRPDPTLSMGYSREQRGQEHLISVGLSIPLPSPAYQAEQSVAQAEVDQAKLQQELLYRQRQLDTATRLESIKQAWLARLQAKQLVKTSEQQQQLLYRAYQLGEISLNDWLVSARQLIQAQQRLDEIEQQLLENASRLRLDQHQLWQDADLHESAT